MGNNDLANIGNLQTIAALARMMGAASGNANTLGNAGVNPMANLGATGE